jgi:hypothetical protein
MPPFGPWPGKSGAGGNYTGPPGGSGSAGTRALSQTNAGAIGPAANVVFTTAGITSTKTGLFHLVGDLSANNTGVSAQTLTLERDAGTVLANGIAGTGGAGPFLCALTATVQLTAGSGPHTFSIRAIANAGTNTIPIGHAQINIIEV